ncbi:Protein unc-79-like [Papilio machaon]|uniref:Protein unc-79-like n=1 Tax=Papilio machaon TaxID=76193 RepID=A0A0N0PBH6_PAPMA|nr:Protein unc-79-like [Papilio machaon]
MSQLAETVNLHFLSLLESLLDCNSTVLNRLLPMWTPVLHSPTFELPRHLAERVAACQEARPDPVRQDAGGAGVKSGASGGAAGGARRGAGGCPRAHRRLHRLMAKMAQLELQPNSFYFI